MLHQSGVRGGPDSPQEDKVEIIFVGGDFEIIARLNLAAGADRFGQY